MSIYDSIPKTLVVVFIGGPRDLQRAAIRHSSGSRYIEVISTLRDNKYSSPAMNVDLEKHIYEIIKVEHNCQSMYLAVHTGVEQYVEE